MSAYPYLQAVYTEYKGPTNSRGSRIIVTIRRGDDTIRRLMSYDYAAHDAHDSAVEKAIAETLEKNGDKWKSFQRPNPKKAMVTYTLLNGRRNPPCPPSNSHLCKSGAGN